MGNIRLNVQAGKKQEIIELETPFDEAKKDEPILSALQKVGAVKDEGYKAQIEELSAAHATAVTELKTAKDEEIKSLREPIEAGIIADRLKQIKGLDVEAEKTYWAGVPTDRLLQDAKHWSGGGADEAEASKTSGELPKELDAEKEQMI